MEMTNADIYKSWREAKDKKEQVKVLADLNCTTQEHIVEILKEQGADGRLLPRKRKPVEEKEPPKTLAVNPDKPARMIIEETRRPKPRRIHEMERMAELFDVILEAELKSETPDTEYVEEFNELWGNYCPARRRWSD